MTDHHHRTSLTALSVVLRLTAIVMCLSAGAMRVHAQTASDGDQATREELEPLTVGRAGTTLIGIAGYVDRFFSSEETSPTIYTAHLDVSRFLTDRLVVRGGVAGIGRIGDEDGDGDVGPGAPALHGIVGGLFYFSPQKVVSLYSGVDYWVQLTQRSGSDAGVLVGTLGAQGALSSRTSLYLEGGYGVSLSKGDDDETLTRYVGRIGVRLKF